MVGREPPIESRVNTGDLGPHAGTTGSTPELYGPWIMAVNRRRRNVRISYVGSDREVRLTKVYLESNLTRCTKAGKSVASGSNRVEVVSLVEDHPTEASVREVPTLYGSHVRGKENKGLRIKKGPGLRPPTRAVLRDWILSVSHVIDVEARRIRHGLEQEYEVMDDDNPDESNSDVEVAVQNMVHGDSLIETGMDVVSSQ
ncbi:hypothetical protein V6N12_014292 [Hibiscus sabdariffa]|uniref:Uncharacterized protein n=1 Tax=Hibiscus sabdariffa TaxID=183260 RepID=A0ABR2DJR0_9ROSI